MTPEPIGSRKGLATLLASVCRVPHCGVPPMLGPRKSRRLDEPIAVSLEDLVPSNHFYRNLEAKLDVILVDCHMRGQGSIQTHAESLV